MRRTFDIARRSVCVLGLAVAFVSVSAAQMGGGIMGGGPGNPNRNGGVMGGNGNGMMNGSIGGMMSGALAGMMGGNSGLTIGPDGTLYITRSVTSPTQTSQNPNSQLAAIDTNGNAKWTLPFNATASQPALGKDGTLFVTTSDWMNWIYSGPNTMTSSKPNLLIVNPGAASATIQTTIPLQGDLASAPQLGSDNAGGYIVYVVTVDMPDGNAMSDNSTAGTYLWAFSPSGTLKYKLQLSQAGIGMMGF
jgi:hypothetical protein